MECEPTLIQYDITFTISTFAKTPLPNKIKSTDTRGEDMNISFFGGHNSTHPEDGERVQGTRMPSTKKAARGTQSAHQATQGSRFSHTAASHLGRPKRPGSASPRLVKTKTASKKPKANMPVS